MYAIFGLGNPGKKYENTRHNIGFNVIDELAKRSGVELNKIKFKSVYQEVFIGGEKVLLVKPQTFMNNSGQAVRELVDFYKLDSDEIVVIYDDIDIDFSALRIKAKGSAGTHNGMKSIINHLQSDAFTRLKIGVGKKDARMDLADFVLSRFSKDEQDDIDIAIKYAADAVEDIVVNGVEHSMNNYNGKKTQ
ncbi:MAG: aminoacyl-tRNA hydrolase [Tissierellia bacterium]|nr:aminoacyl-tRNA hydrolase [Tissierellia bacterium]